MRALMTALAGFALLALPADLEAQARRGQQPAQLQQQPQTRAADIQLVYEREVFTYAGDGRRDPFRPLTGQDDMGPRFDQLALQGIIYSTGRTASVAILTDASGRVHRVRQGDVVGNSRVVEIGQLRVVMAVETFGTVRQEMLELPRRGGAQR